MATRSILALTPEKRRANEQKLAERRRLLNQQNGSVNEPDIDIQQKPTRQTTPAERTEIVRSYFQLQVIQEIFQFISLMTVALVFINPTLNLTSYHVQWVQLVVSIYVGYVVLSYILYFAGFKFGLKGTHFPRPFYHHHALSLTKTNAKHLQGTDYSKSIMYTVPILVNMALLCILSWFANDTIARYTLTVLSVIYIVSLFSYLQRATRSFALQYEIHKNMTVDDISHIPNEYRGFWSFIFNRTSTKPPNTNSNPASDDRQQDSTEDPTVMMAPDLGTPPPDNLMASLQAVNGDYTDGPDSD